MHDEPTTQKRSSTKPRVSGVVTRENRADPTGPFACGATIGGTYEIRGVLGAGGMGVVYEAFDRGLGRRVAIKTALASVFATALRAEAHTLAALRSPSFVDVYALGCHDEVDFLVMELLHGERLDRRIDEAIACETFVPLGEVIHALIGLARALRAAHEAAVSQRDVKPANTIVAGERVVLFDFGLALPEVLVEETSIISGSVDYLAPELICGQVRRGDGALVDLYALGITAYELLTNRTPFGRDSAERTLSRHVTDIPPDVREIRPDVPGELAFLVRDLLEKDPADRPSTAEAVLWELETIKSQLEHPKSRRPIAVVAVMAEHRFGHALKKDLESRFHHLAVETTTNPVLSLSTTSRAPLDVVLLDLDLPDHNCVEICARIGADPRRPMVIGLANHASCADLALLRSLGVQQILSKSANLVPELARIIRQLHR